MTARWSLLVGAALLGGCGGTIVDGQEGGVDAGSEGGSGVCNPQPSPFADGGMCQTVPAARGQLCQQWAQSLITSGYAYASCGDGPCQMGNHCGIDSVTGMYLCDCDGYQCMGGEVCVSDTPNGPATCRPICVPDCPNDGCKVPGSLCRCYVDDLCSADEFCNRLSGYCESRSSCPDQ